MYFRKVPYTTCAEHRIMELLSTPLSAFLCRVIRALACCEQGPKIRAHRIIKTIACCPTKSTTNPEPDSRTIHLDLPKVRLQRRPPSTHSYLYFPFIQLRIRDLCSCNQRPLSRTRLTSWSIPFPPHPESSGSATDPLSTTTVPTDWDERRPLWFLWMIRE